MADQGVNSVAISSSFSAKLIKWRVCEGQIVREGTVIAFYEKLGQSDSAKAFITQPKLKSSVNGRVRKLLAAEGDIIKAGKPVALIEKAGICEHNTIMKDLCCDCGADLRKLQAEQDEPSSPLSATISMIHNIPELKVTQDEAKAVGKQDEERLLSARKLALVVDLDQTLIHTTVQLVPADMKGVQHFCLPGHPMWYHTKFRPWAHKFLQKISNVYELHIFTMGSRMYAHTIACMLDPDKTLFGYRIRSRDDCLDAFSKSNDLSSLFPCGDSMVCIIDDRVDVWNNAPNLIKVKPYQFFKGVGDINAPPDKQENNPAGEGSEAEKPATQEGDKSSENNPMGEESEAEKPAIQEGDNIGENNPMEEESKVEKTDVQEGASSGENNPTVEGSESEQSGNQEGDSSSENNPSGEGSVDANPKDEIMNSLNDKMDGIAHDGEENSEHCMEEQDEKTGKYSVEKEGIDLKEKKNYEEKTAKVQLVNGSNNNVCPGKMPADLTEEKLEGSTDVKENADESNVNHSTVKESNSEGMETCDGDQCDRAEEKVEDNDKHADSMESPEDKTVKPADQEPPEKDKADEKEDGKYAYEDEDDYLLHLEEALERIHEKFYSVLDQIKAKTPTEARNDPNIMKYCTPDGTAPCTKQILKELRLEVLRGANIVFTGVIPTNVQPEKSEIWRRTLGLGAKISNQIITPKEGKGNPPGDVTTHVVAARLGTEKAYRAIKTPGIKLVSPQWLLCCEDRWEWVDERLFPVEGIEKYKKQIRTQDTPRGTPHNWVSANEENDSKIGVTVNEGDSNSEGDPRSRTCSSSSADVLMASLHPLLSFSSTEMEAIDKEVEDLMHSDGEESDVIGSISGSSSSSSGSSDEESEDEKPSTRKRKSGDGVGDDDVDDILTKKRKKDERASDETDDYTRRSSPSDDDDADDDMAALLEAELSHY